MNGLIIVVALVGCAYAQLESPMALAMLSGGMRGGAGAGGATGGIDPLSLAVLGGNGNSKMLQMMTLMNLMKKSPTTPAAEANNAIAQPKATQDNTAVNPMMNSLMTLTLCKISETAGDQRFCTPFTCKLESLRRYANPNLLQCQQMMGCCFKDMRSMYIANMMKGL
ncbi:uncharacterized protein LOC134282174 [Saccostrea cucullata]|uniref:uncharacterized protein LOC134282174 n=1 Tax=Saccostrea cuccullata TaxID=36930 RepID=UPI002ED65CEF